VLRRNGVILTLTAVVIVACLGTGCAKQGEASRNNATTDTTRIGGPTDQTGGTPSTMAGSWVQERQSIETRLNSTIKTLDTRIEHLSQQSSNASGKAKERIDDQIDKFKGEREKLTDDLRDLGQASQDDWDSVRDRINKSLVELDTTMGDKSGTTGTRRGTTSDTLRDTTR
jgi:cytochrome c556